MVQYTKKAIAESFLQLLNERPFDKISVVDIAEKCGINRNTFYYYYTDVFALVDDVFRMRPAVIIRHFDLRRPIYRQLACYGHFGDNAKNMTALNAAGVVLVLAAIVLLNIKSRAPRDDADRAEIQ